MSPPEATRVTFVQRKSNYVTLYLRYSVGFCKLPQPSLALKFLHLRANGLEGCTPDHQLWETQMVTKVGVALLTLHVSIFYEFLNYAGFVFYCCVLISPKPSGLKQ